MVGFLFICCHDRKFATFSASNELPLSIEDGLLFWLNKCSAMFAERLNVDPISNVPLMDLRDVSNGRSLAIAISFYRPNDVPAYGTFYCGCQL